MLTNKAKRDYDLILKAKTGDQRAFEQLMNLYSRNILFEIQKLVKNQEEANDLMMEAMAKAFEQLKSYEPKFAFSTWLKRISVNHTIDYLRKKRIDAVSLDEAQWDEGQKVGMEIATEEMNPIETLLKQERILAIRNVVSELKGIYKDLITLRYFEELSYAEISEQTSIPVGTVKARLHRAKGILKNMMIEMPLASQY